MENALNGRFSQGDIGGVGFRIGAESTNEITVNIQLLDRSGKELAKRGAIIGYLSSDANGDSPRTASGTLSLAAGADGAYMELATDNPFLLISEADGDIDLVITETAATTTHYLNIILPNGEIVTSGPIYFA